MKKLLVIFFMLLAIQNIKAQLPDGSIAPDFNLQDLNGNYHHLYDILDSGMFVIIDFYGVMCGPCWTYYNSGSMEKAYLKYGPQGTNQLRAFMIECQESSDNQIKGIQQPTKGDWTNLISFPTLYTHAPNTRAVVEAYHPVGIPFFFIICPDKRVRQMHSPDSAAIHDAMMDCPVGPHDSLYLAFAKIDSLKPFSCNNFISPEIQIQNYGIDTIHNFRTMTYLNDVKFDSAVWYKNMKTFVVDKLNINYSSLPNGSYNMKIKTDRINGKQNIVPDSITARFTVSVSSQQLPLNEDFSSAYFPYNKWTITKEKLVFPDWDWINLNYAQSVYLPLFNIPFGYGNDLILPRFDFSQTITPVMSFNYAYAKNPQKMVDEISIGYMADCNDTWHLIRFMNNDTIITAPDCEEFFIPTAGQWKTFIVNLSAVPKNPDVFIRIRGTSHNAGSFYLDNLSVRDIASSVASYNKNDDEISVFPNPANDKIAIRNLPTGINNIKITDITGKEVIALKTDSEDEVKLDLGNICNGLYIITIQNERNISSKKLVISR